MLDLLPRVILVRAEWDADAADWTAQSADIPGLVAEADTLELLQAKLPGMVADLIELNGMHSDLPDIPISIVASAVSRVAVPRP